MAMGCPIFARIAGALTGAAAADLKKRLYLKFEEGPQICIQFDKNFSCDAQERNVVFESTAPSHGPRVNENDRGSMLHWSLAAVIGCR
jgi:hypothetical protein